MAIAQTGAIYKALTFDGTSSRTYGVYITGEAVYNAPERAVEMITIPGRNGAFALDKGHFENIEVSYPAGIFADTEADFAQAVSDFRNFLCSKRGYCKLSDEYNSGEYRMAIYKSGLEVTPTMLRAGEFTITFECKPQRFLTSGDTASAVTSGGTLTNPTLFPSSPLLEVSGYGDITIGGGTMTVSNAQIGNVQAYSGGGNTLSTSFTFTIDNQFANTGDTMTFPKDGAIFRTTWVPVSGYIYDSYISGSVGNGFYNAGMDNGTARMFDYRLYAYNDPSLRTFNYGTAKTVSQTDTYTFELEDYTPAETGSIAISLAYNGTTSFTLTVTETLPTHMTELVSDRSIEIKTVTLNSTKLAAGTSTFIDLAIGEAYKISGGDMVSVNNLVSIPAELPTLPSGNSTVTFDNTFSTVKVAPRWWKV